MLENKFALWSAVPGQDLPGAASTPEAHEGVWFSSDIPGVLRFPVLVSVWV